MFMEAQAYEIEENILYQNNQSMMRLLEYKKRSSGKWTRALNIQYFFLHDQAKKGNLKFGYCPTGEMLGDYNTKLLNGALFKQMRMRLMGMSWGVCFIYVLCDVKVFSEFFTRMSYRWMFHFEWVWTTGVWWRNLFYVFWIEQGSTYGTKCTCFYMWYVVICFYLRFVSTLLIWLKKH